jgi:hypothetical protein
LLLLLALLPAPGCSRDEKLPPTFPVSGTVSWKGGGPLSGGQVQLVAAVDAGLTVTGTIDREGKFSVSTSKNRKKVAGAPAGDYRVTVYPPELPDTGPPVPVTLPRPFRVQEKENQLPITLDPPRRRARK